MIKNRIKDAIGKSLPGSTIFVANPGEDGQHFEAIVISPDFEGKPLVRQHQTVLNALKKEFDGSVVHALQLKTFTPNKWESEKHQFNIPEGA